MSSYGKPVQIELNGISIDFFAGSHITFFGNFCLICLFCVLCLFFASKDLFLRVSE